MVMFVANATLNKLVKKYNLGTMSSYKFNSYFFVGHPRKRMI